MVAVLALAACAATPRAAVVPQDATVSYPNDPHVSHTVGGDPLSCTERATTPLIDNAYDARWSPDSRSLVVSRIVTIPNPRMITGYE